MKQNNRSTQIWLSMGAIAGLACSTLLATPQPLIPTATQTPKSSLTPTPSRTLAVLATPTQATGVATATELGYFDQLNTAAAALPTVVESTPVPPLQRDNAFVELRSQDMYVLFSSSTRDQNGSIVSVYLFAEADFAARSTGGDPETPGCWLLFYRSDSSGNTHLGTIPAPQYPIDRLFFYYPHFCQTWGWNSQTTYDLSFPPAEEVRQALSLNGVWSDINQNGSPEFSVTYRYCAGSGCGNPGETGTHFYEVRPDGEVVDITADLPGLIEPASFIYSISPPGFYVDDVEHYYGFRKWIYVGWIYEWDGEKLVDVSPRHAEYYRSLATARLEWALEQRDAGGFDTENLLSILFLYEKAGLSEEGLNVFLEATDPAEWQGFDSDIQCWLQIVRATAIQDLEQGEPFRLPLADLDNYGGGSFSQSVERVFRILSPEDFDLSICVQYLRDNPAD